MIRAVPFRVSIYVQVLRHCVDSVFIRAFHRRSETPTDYYFCINPSRVPRPAQGRIHSIGDIVWDSLLQ